MIKKEDAVALTSLAQQDLYRADFVYTLKHIQPEIDTMITTAAKQGKSQTFYSASRLVHQINSLNNIKKIVKELYTSEGYEVSAHGGPTNVEFVISW